MRYRPEGWDNPYKYKDSSAAIYFEAGADAMLEALEENGMDIKEGCISCVVALPPPFGLKKGKIVFIPEEV